MSAQPHRQTETETVVPRDYTATEGRVYCLRLRDQAALATLYDRYAPMLYALTFAQLGSVTASEAVVLDVFVQFGQAARLTLTPDQPAGTQLCQLAAHRLEAEADKTARLQGLSLEGQPHPTLGSQVLRAFSQLTEPQQQVLGLALSQGLTLTQLAAQSDMSARTVKSHCHAALRRLRTLLSAVAW